MINGLHLLWIVPIALIVGIVVEAMLMISKDDDDKK